MTLLAIAIDVPAVLARLAVDVVAITVLALGLSFRRHARPDLVVLFVTFNLGLFAAVIVIAGGEIPAAVGFGLFAVLSIIRLRAETLTNPEIAYFFAAVVTGLVCGVDLGGPLANAVLALLVLAGPAIADQPRFLKGERRWVLTLDEAIAEPAALRAAVEQRLGTPVLGVAVLELDFVRETTQVQVRLDATPGTEVPRELVAR